MAVASVIALPTVQSAGLLWPVLASLDRTIGHVAGTSGLNLRVGSQSPAGRVFFQLLCLIWAGRRVGVGVGVSITVAGPRRIGCPRVGKVVVPKGAPIHLVMIDLELPRSIA
jgi:hypothetical protein